ncbi:DUF58 domain-containing protein [Oscillochloris sp. ZM17-4]|uniref:DUF58 domain-containing protein n=1 Tax=Oscillochloris sp. ZM17-4 TaxID=2866714 RepID=UPI001C731547|nr:DUF58 domain-containing protein [Oscillochloris sp. ZM17-4]MBX0327837.1 DUF58 domain-containing protein [Oscillochloris sp. ZM17-4]
MLNSTFNIQHSTFNIRMADLRVLTLVLLAVAAALRSEIFFYLLYMLVGFQAVAWLWVRQVSRGLRWAREVPATAFPGEPVDIQIAISNHSLLPMPWLSIYESVPPALRTLPAVRRVVSLGAGERRVVSYTVQGQRRGLYRLGPLRLQTGDVLGLREQPLSSGGTDALVILPQVLPLAELGLPAALPFGARAAPRSLFTDPARPVGVRDYQAGDAMRQIDWKSSARIGALQVRRQQPAIARETLVALAFSHAEYPSRYSYDAQERAVVAAASIIADLIGRRLPAGLCSSGRDPLTDGLAATIGPGDGRAHLLAMLRLLGRLEAPAEGDIAAALSRASAGLSWGSTVVLICLRAGPDTIERLLPLRRRGLLIALVLIDGEPDDLTLARRHGMHPYTVTRAGAPVEP